MKTGIYVDVLLTVNFVINYLLLRLSCTIAGRTRSIGRLLLSAGVGALGSLIIFLPLQNTLVLTGFKLLLSGAMVAIVAGRCPVRQFLFDWLIFFVVNFFFAGLMLALWVLRAPDGMFYYNGVVYFDLSVFTLLGVTTLAYLLFSLFQRKFRAQTALPALCQATLVVQGHSIDLTARMDTGNGLQDPYSGAPVALCTLEPLRALPCLQNVSPDLPLAQQLQQLPGFRLIPYGTVGHRGMMPAFHPDRITWQGVEGPVYCEDFLLAVTPERPRGMACDLLLHPQMVERQLNRSRG